MTDSGSAGRAANLTASRSNQVLDQPRRLRDHYDWVVVGDDPGALLSGCLAAKQGLSVLLLRTTPDSSVIVAKNKQIFDPEPNWISGLGVGPHGDGLLRHCLSQLGVQPVEWAAVRKEAADLQILTPQVRFRLGKAHLELVHELERETGGDLLKKSPWLTLLESSEQRLSAFWLGHIERLTFRFKDGGSSSSPGAPIPDSRKVDKASLERHLREISGSPEIQKVLAALKADAGLLENLGLGLQDYEDAARALLWGVLGTEVSWDRPEEVLKALALARTSSAFQGGRSALKRLLTRVALRLGAHLPQGRYCKRIFADRGKLTGVQLSQSGNVIGVTGLGLGISLDEASSLLSEEDRVRSALRRAEPVRGWLFTVSLTVAGSSLPPGFSERMIWSSRNSPCLSLEVAAPQDFGAEVTDQRIVLIRSELPFSEETLDPDYLRLMAARMVEQVNRISPGFSGRIIQSFPDYTKPDTAQWAEAYPFKRLSDMPEFLRVYGPGIQKSGATSGVDGIFVATRESDPSMGDFAGVLAGIEAAAWIAHRNGLSGPV
jgi:hypothetical protein